MNCKHAHTILPALLCLLFEDGQEAAGCPGNSSPPCTRWCTRWKNTILVGLLAAFMIASITVLVQPRAAMA